MTLTQPIGQSPFNPVKSFFAVATGDEKVKLVSREAPIIKETKNG